MNDSTPNTPPNPPENGTQKPVETQSRRGALDFQGLMVVIAFLVITSGYSINVYLNRGGDKTETPPNTEETPQTSTDWTKDVYSHDAYADARALRAQGDYDGAIRAYNTVKDDVSGSEAESIVAMEIAGATFEKDAPSGARAYGDIYHNESFPALTRATAFLMMYLQHAGTGNTEMVRPFFTEEEFTEFSNRGTLTLESARRIHRLFPFVIPGAVLARNEIRSYDSAFPLSTTKPDDILSAEGERVYQKYFSLFDSNIAFLEDGEGMKQFVPNTYLAHAVFAADLAYAGYNFTAFNIKEKAIALFTESLARARAQGNPITEEFVMVRFANHHARMGNTDAAKELLTSLLTDGLTPMMRGYLKTEKAQKEIPEALMLVQSDSAITALLNG